jgi:ATP-binding cassette subfamily C protein
MQVVLQHGRLSGGSIFTNIAGNGTLTEEDAWRAARMVGLASDIEAMPMGMHTVVTEGVNTLSGGQRQRLLLARALAQHPAILVLDEPTSALDNTTQDLVMNSLKHLTGTRIVIAHRLSTVRHVDRIVVMDRGKVVQQGRFETLLAEGGLFAEIAKRQMV